MGESPHLWGWVGAHDAPGCPGCVCVWTCHCPLGGCRGSSEQRPTSRSSHFSRSLTPLGGRGASPLHSQVTLNYMHSLRRVETDSGETTKSKQFIVSFLMSGSLFLLLFL